MVYHNLVKILVIQNVKINKWAYEEHGETTEVKTFGVWRARWTFPCPLLTCGFHQYQQGNRTARMPCGIFLIEDSPTPTTPKLIIADTYIGFRFTGTVLRVLSVYLALTRPLRKLRHRKVKNLPEPRNVAATRQLALVSVVTNPTHKAISFA